MELYAYIIVQVRLGLDVFGKSGTHDNLGDVRPHPTHPWLRHCYAIRHMLVATNISLHPLGSQIKIVGHDAVIILHSYYY